MSQTRYEMVKAALGALKNLTADVDALTDTCSVRACRSFCYYAQIRFDAIKRFITGLGHPATAAQVADLVKTNFTGDTLDSARLLSEGVAGQAAGNSLKDRLMAAYANAAETTQVEDAATGHVTRSDVMVTLDAAMIADRNALRAALTEIGSLLFVPET